MTLRLSSIRQNHGSHRLFELQVERVPDAVALAFEGRSLTYRELDERSDRLAEYLVAHGVAKDVPVAVFLERSLDLYVAILGVLKAGAPYVPVDPAYPLERIRLILEDCGAPLVLTHPPLAEKLPETAAAKLCIESFASPPGSPAPLPSISADSLAYLIYTSGSTGRPKGVAMPHAALSNLIEWQLATMPLRASGRVLQFSALSFDASFQEMISTWGEGGTLISIPEETRRDPDALIRLIEEQRIERIFLPFVALQMLASTACRLAIYPPGLRDVVTAGEQLRITRDIRQMFSRMEDCRLHNLYGPSETHVVTSYTLQGVAADWPSLPPIGRELPDVSIHLLDDNLAPVPNGVAGELYAGGIALARGYWNRPDLTRERFIENTPHAPRLYKTGDLARRTPTGDIDFLGRTDHQVKIRGYRIELAEVETALGQHPDVRECSVIAREDSAGDKRLVAYFVPCGPAGTIGLRDYLKARLPEHMVPSTFVPLPNLPVTPSGKLDRMSLPEPGVAAPFLAPDGGGPSTLVELQLTQIWARVLGVPTVRVNDDFFDLGGHSLLAVRLLNEIHPSFHQSFPLAVFFQNPTVKAMARVIETESSAGSKPQHIRLQPGTSPGSLYFLDAAIGLCRLAQLLIPGPSSFATVVPLTRAALHAAASGAKTGLPSVEELAASHAALIRSHHPAGPIILAGHSFGGVLAFEVAQQLHREGLRVEAIVLLDSWARVPHWSQRLRTMTFSRAQASLAFRVRSLWSRLHAGRTTPVALQEESASWRVLEKIHCQATDNYRFHPLNSRAILLRATQNEFAHYHTLDRTLGWNGLFTGGLEIVETPGDHISLLMEPHLSTLARQLQPRLCRLED